MKLRAETLRIFTTVHTWSGLIAGMALFIAFYAGALDMVHGSIQRWSDPEQRYQQPVAGDGLQRLVSDAYARYPEAVGERFFLHLPGPGVTQPILEWRDGIGRQVNAYTITTPGAEPLERDREAHTRLADFVDELHFTLGLPVQFGRYLLGVICIVFGVALLSGIVIHLPRLIRDLFALRPGSNRKRFWLDAHNVVGVLGLPFHLMFMITSALFTINVVAILGANTLVYNNALGPATDQLTEIAHHREETGVKVAMVPIDALVAKARTVLPGLQPETVIAEHYGDEHTDITVRGAVPRTMLHEAVVIFDGATGEVRGYDHLADSKPSQIAINTVQSLHFGDFGGPLLRWLYFFLGLSGAWLFYTGNLLWIESRRRRRSIEQPRHHRWLAGATVGVCVGCMLGLSAAFVANRLLPADLPLRALWETRVYFIAFFAAMAWALWRPPIRAATELLAATALATALIPLSNGFTTGDWLWHSAASGLWPVFGVDAVAVTGAVAFVLMARVSARRGRTGSENSVWHAEAAGSSEPATKRAPGRG